jgi:hypothetical protein
VSEKARRGGGGVRGVRKSKVFDEVGVCAFMLMVSKAASSASDSTTSSTSRVGT